MPPLSAPAPLSGDHQLADFDCGVLPLNEWLRLRATRNEESGASRTYVICDEAVVIGYYALASGGVSLNIAPRRFRRNMPDPIPVAILGRLAIDRRYQRRGLGHALYQDAVERILHAASVIGIRGILVQAISPEARAFYEALGFESSTVEAMTLMLTLADVRKVFSRPPDSG